MEQGQAFVAAFTDELLFRLEPETHPNNPHGWTIQIIPATDSQSDYATVATPPYRFSNPRYVNTAYGITAEQALSWTPREFAFVADAPAYESAKEALAVLLWPGNYTQSEVAQAETALAEVLTYPGQFWIEDGATAETSSLSPRGRIDWIRFRLNSMFLSIQPGRPLGAADGAGSGWANVRSNVLCNLGYGNQSKLFPRNPRLRFEEACRLL